MYYADLSKYKHHDASLDLVHVGWLDEKHEFPKREVSNELLERVLEMCFTHRREQTRGFHQSPFHESREWYSVTWNNKQMFLGSASIWVLGHAGRIYAAPNLIYHYMKDCKYHPPQEFLDGVAERRPLPPGAQR